MSASSTSAQTSSASTAAASTTTSANRSPQGNGGGGGSEEGGDWRTINTKKAKKTRNKRQRPVPLRDFFSDGGSNLVSRELIRAPRAPRCASPAAPGDLNDEEEAMVASIRSYFSDALRIGGPARADSIKMRERLASLDQPAKDLVARFPSLEVFLAGSSDLAVVDSVICAREDEAKARKMMEEIIVNNRATSSASLSSVAVVGPQKPANEAPTVSSWSKPLVTSQSSASGSAASSAQQRLYSSLGLPQIQPDVPNLPPKPIQKPETTAATVPSGPLNGRLFNGVAAAVTPVGGFGGIGNVSGNADGASATRVIQGPTR